MVFLSAVAPLCALIAFIYGPAPADTLPLAYCSSQNTGSQFDPQTSTFQSNGLCTNTCSAQYVFAVLLGNQCWCSNYVPEETTSVDDCDTSCPGYPSDKCGNTQDNYFAYILIDSRVPSGTTTGSTVIPTSGASSTTATTTSGTAPTTTTGPTAPGNTSPVVSVQTIAGQPTTITIVGSDSATSTPSPSVHRDSSGLSGGAIAGVVIGTLVGVGALAALGLWFLFAGRRRQSEPSPSPNSQYDPSVQNGFLENRRQSKASQMSLMRNFFPSDQEKPPVSPTSGGPSGFVDNRMKKDATLYPHGTRHSTVSLRDDQDYSRPVLRLTNPD